MLARDASQTRPVLIAVRLGSEKVLRGCVRALVATFTAAAIYGVVSQAPLWARAGMTVGHSVMATALVWRARQVDVTSSKSMYDLYMFVWKLFYAEYLLVPLFRG